MGERIWYWLNFDWLQKKKKLLFLKKNVFDKLPWKWSHSYCWRHHPLELEQHLNHLFYCYSYCSLSRRPLKLQHWLQRGHTRSSKNHPKHSLSAVDELILSLVLTVIPDSPWSPLYPLSPLGPETNKAQCLSASVGYGVNLKATIWEE